MDYCQGQICQLYKCLVFYFIMVTFQTVFCHDKHGVPMGVKTPGCDTGEYKLEVDWDGRPSEFTCYQPKNRLPVDQTIRPLRTCFDIPSDYMPQHYCMSRTIEYEELIPTFGDHRPLWPIYGEYRYLPVQRWLHSLEHGAIVMLYHPCADPMEVAKLRHVLTYCLRRHVITPNKYLTRDRPLALIAWGCRLEINYVNQTEATNFIKKLAMKAPETMNALQGQYEQELLHVSDIVPNSDYLDHNVCPDENFV